MKTQNALSNRAGRLTTACAKRLLPLLLLLALPGAVRAQFSCTTNNGTLTITGYTGPGGAVTIPSTINGLPVTSIGADAFWFCTSLTSVTIPSSVATIGDGAFFGCSSLTNVTIPNSVTSIGAAAFCECPSLTSVTIPNSVTTIGDIAFYACTSLTSVTIPARVISIGNTPFQNCSSLTAITVNALNSSYSSVDGVLFDKGQTTLLEYPGGLGGSYTIPGSVTSIAAGAFYGCTSLTGITIPNSVSSIGDQAFNGCGSLTSVTIPNGVATIGVYAFEDCTSLTSATIPNSVTDIGGGAFAYCGSLTAITVGTLNSVYSSLAGVLFNKSQTTLIAYPGGKAGTSYTIPNSVTNIGYGAFYYCSGLASVTIGNSVASIGEQAFEGCTSLTSVTIPNSVTSIGDEAFCNCPSLTGVTIPNSVTSIGASAFSGCTSLANVTIPSGVVSIGDWAFSFCGSLAKVYFEGNAPSLGLSVFDGDNNATIYYLPGTTGWDTTFGGRPTSLLALPPSILTPPLTQTAEMGSLAGFWVEATNIPPAATYQWYFNGTNALGGATNCYVVLANVQPAQAGAYMVAVTNLCGAVTSAPALLSVIAAVERRVVPALNLTADVGSFLQVDYVNGFGPGAQWLSLSNVTIESTPQLCFDLSEPLPAQRFYRTSQTNAPSARPVLDMRLATEIPLTGAIGSSVRIDYINQFGPTDAWVTLDTVTLTNTTQLYFDVTMFRQPTRLYRLAQVP